MLTSLRFVSQITIRKCLVNQVRRINHEFPLDYTNNFKSIPCIIMGVRLIWVLRYSLRILSVMKDNQRIRAEFVNIQQILKESNQI